MTSSIKICPLSGVGMYRVVRVSALDLSSLVKSRLKVDGHPQARHNDIGSPFAPGTSFSRRKRVPGVMSVRRSCFRARLPVLTVASAASLSMYAGGGEVLTSGG